MNLGTTYICVNDIQKSLAFYKLLLQKEPLYANEENKHFNQAYINDFFIDKGEPQNNIVILNFEVDDLKQEYE